MTDMLCPNCGRDVSGATHMEDPERQPSHNDLSVCFYCGQQLIFTAREDSTLYLRNLTPEFKRDLEPEILKQLDVMSKAVKNLRLLGLAMKRELK